MMRRSNSSREISEDIEEIQRLIGDLQRRLVHLSRATVRGPVSELAGATREAGDTVAQTAGRFLQRVREGAQDVGGETVRYVRSVADDTGRYGGRALRRIGEGVESRPLLLLAAAAVIGLLAAGFAARRV